MTEIPKPEIAEAPGLVWRPRKGGWVATWQARTDIVQAGFEPQTARLWAGTEPSDIEKAHIATQCKRLHADMMLWSKDRTERINVFDGTLRTLINCYQTDPDSRYHKKRFATRRNHDTLLRRIAEKHGAEQLIDIKGRTLLSWHGQWSDGGKMLATGQAIKGQLRVLFSFGFTILEDLECERLCNVMSKMQFDAPTSRNQAITADQAVAVRNMAREWFGWGSIALAQALQFELMLRQKDVIGEWVPISEPGTSDLTWRGQKWLRGLRWSEVNENLILRHTTSKRQKDLEVDLKLAPMVMEELALMADVPVAMVSRDLFPASGPLVRNEIHAFPYADSEFRRKWRKVAIKAGVPKNVFNMDSRAGGITEASDSGADMEHIRQAATHSDIAMTQKYNRNSAEKVANVMRIRVEGRNKPKTE